MINYHSPSLTEPSVDQLLTVITKTHDQCPIHSLVEGLVKLDSCIPCIHMYSFVHKWLRLFRLVSWTGANPSLGLPRGSSPLPTQALGLCHLAPLVRQWNSATAEERWQRQLEHLRVAGWSRCNVYGDLNEKHYGCEINVVQLCSLCSFNCMAVPSFGSKPQFGLSPNIPRAPCRGASDLTR